MTLKFLFQQCAIIVMFMTIICYAQITLDPCYSNPCLPMATCISRHNNSYYTCECPDGFSGDGIKNCTDVCNPNPCTEDNFSCHTNFNALSSGSKPYTCTCDSPFNLTAEDKCCGSWCPSSSQTSSKPGNTFANLFKAQNTEPGCQSHCYYLSYTCADNYVSYQNPPKCTEYNVCDPVNPCGNGNCTVDQNNNKKFICACNAGFKKDKNGHCYDDINECEEQTACKDANAGLVCTNTYGGYNCSCDSNYTIAALQDDDTFVCIPRDVCKENNGECEQNCENTPEGPVCSCVVGFTKDGNTCRLNEKSKYVECDKSCSHSEDFQAGICLNNTCQCFSGYRLKDGICIPEYSCLDIDNNCYFGFQCVNITERPGYTCNCNDTLFMTGSDGRCYDIDECATGEDECGENSSCINTNGGHKCRCNPGFIKNGTECTELPNICFQPSTLGTCNNFGETCRQQSPGDYDCYCAIPSMPMGNGDSGYICAPPDSSIFIYSLSMKLLGTNYSEDSFNTRRLLEKDLYANLFPNILSVPVLNLEVVKYQLLAASNSDVSVNLLFNQDVSYLANLMKEICSNYSFIDNSCILPSHFVTVVSSISITDITNSTICNNVDLLCGENAKCRVGNHDFSCQCLNSYKPSGYANSRKAICSDANECLENPSICGSPTQHCVNSVGNYSCECLPCFIWDNSHSDCQFICQDNPCQNNGFCQPLMTQNICGYGCTCSQEYFGPNCEYGNSSLHVAKNNEAIIGGVLGGLLLIMIGISIFLVYKMFKWKGYFSIQKRKPGNI